MKIYHNGDRCPCCGTVIQDKSREWLLEFSALCQALGFLEENCGPMRASAPTEGPGPSRTPEDGMRIFRRGGQS